MPDQVGVHLPRVAADQFHAGVPVARGDLEPGDAVFFANPGGQVHHVGLYIGDAGSSTPRKAARTCGSTR